MNKSERMDFLPRLKEIQAEKERQRMSIHFLIPVTIIAVLTAIYILNV